MTIILAGTIRVAPDRLADLRPHLRAQVENSRAEPGCLDYALTEDPLDPGLIRVYEHFVDEEALAFHRASPHMAAWRACWPCGRWWACATRGTAWSS